MFPIIKNVSRDYKKNFPLSRHSTNLIHLSVRISCFSGECKIAKIKTFYLKVSKPDSYCYKSISLLLLVSKRI